MEQIIPTPKNLFEFLSANYRSKNIDSSFITHTRMPDKTGNSNFKGGGSYIISDQNLPTFWSFYLKSLKYNNVDSLTECTLDEKGPIAIDFDFRYNLNINTRQYTKDDIERYINIIIKQLSKIAFLDNTVCSSFKIYVMEKAEINLKNESIVKDGIHFIIAVALDRQYQILLRQMVVEELNSKEEYRPLNAINDWDNIYDESVSAYKSKWMVYKCRKPGNLPYLLTNIYRCNISEDGIYNIQLDPNDTPELFHKNIDKRITELSVRNSSHPTFPINPSYTKKSADIVTKKKKSKHAIVNDDSDDDDNLIHSSQKQDDYSYIKNSATLYAEVSAIMKELSPDKYYIKEAHQYAQILPELFYKPGGSHDMNTKLAFALKATSGKLFLSWIMVRSKAEDFNFEDIPQLLNRWKGFNANNNLYTIKSIHFWAKEYARNEYEELRSESVEVYINKSLNGALDYDIALVAFKLLGNNYICTDISSKVWYKFENHRWKLDPSLKARKDLSVLVFNEYEKRMVKCKLDIEALQQQNPEDTTQRNNTNTDKDSLESRIKSIKKVQEKLKTTSCKNNIYCEMMSIFYDEEFNIKHDENRQLLCFTNGVFDFNQKIFRCGEPNDYVTLCTNIEYIEPDSVPYYQQHKQEITEFMQKLMPYKEMNKYMWEHLASCIIGTQKQETFNVYLGQGSNGKSKLMDLMTNILGDYKGTMPITAITDRRVKAGCTNSELMQLKGKRYAVMNEPTKGMCLNDGVMKEMTGGDYITGRDLYSKSTSFKPQFKLVVCSNVLFKVLSDDEGTWRRIRICKFPSTFVDNDRLINYNQETKNDEEEEEQNFIFPKDLNLDQKLKDWAPVFMSMLIEIIKETDGVVHNCKMVMAASDEYRETQSIVMEYVKARLNYTGKISDKLSKKDIYENFQTWAIYDQQIAKSKSSLPKITELFTTISKKYNMTEKHKSHIFGFKMAIIDNDEPF